VAIDLVRIDFVALSWAPNGKIEDAEISNLVPGLYVCRSCTSSSLYLMDTHCTESSFRTRARTKLYQCTLYYVFEFTLLLVLAYRAISASCTELHFTHSSLSQRV